MDGVIHLNLYGGKLVNHLNLSTPSKLVLSMQVMEQFVGISRYVVDRYSNTQRHIRLSDSCWWYSGRN